MPEPMTPTDEKLIASAREITAAQKWFASQGMSVIDKRVTDSLEALASRLEQALSTGPAHDAGLIEAVARVGELIEQRGPSLRPYADHNGFDLHDKLRADLRLILQALAGE